MGLGLQWRGRLVPVLGNVWSMRRRSARDDLLEHKILLRCRRASIVRVRDSRPSLSEAPTSRTQGPLDILGVVMRQRVVVATLGVGLILAGASQWYLIKEVQSLRVEIGALQAAPRTQAAAPSRGRTLPGPLPDAPLVLTGSQTKGQRSAKVAIVIYSDFQCPYCGVFVRKTWPLLEKEYVETGRVLVAFRHFPLGNHELAEGAAEAAECAARQGSFWRMHDRLFADQGSLEPANLRETARELGLDLRKFESCTDGQARDHIRADIASGREVSVSGTPTFFLGTLNDDARVVVKQRISGAKDFAEFKRAIESVLATVSVSAH